MARHRSLDEIVEEIEHARPVHPLRELIAHRFYLDNWISYEGGLALVLFNGLLAVPFIFSLFFYPVQALTGLGVVLIVTGVLYTGFVISRARNADKRRRLSSTE
jgi:hypothetical protein